MLNFFERSQIVENVIVEQFLEHEEDLTNI